MTARRVLWVGGAILGLYVLSMMLMPSDEKRIGKLVEKARVACEHKDAAALMGLFDLAYRDGDGMTYASWNLLFQDAFRKYDDIRVRVLTKEVDVDDNGKDATVTLTARGEATLAATKGDAGRAADRPIGQVENAEITLRKGPTGWKIRSARNLHETEW